LAIVLEHMPLETIEADRAQKPSRDDAIGVDVVAGQRHGAPLDVGDCRHQLTSSRTSVTSPATAAAATIAGLINSVRPVGLPCRPLKFLLDDDAQTWRPSSLSGFIARHIEQPAPRHSKPASMNTWCSPRFSASCATSRDPGTIRAFTCFATLWPFTMRAASWMSDSRPFVQDPMNATSIFVPRIGVFASKLM